MFSFLFYVRRKLFFKTKTNYMYLMLMSAVNLVVSILSVFDQWQPFSFLLCFCVLSFHTDMFSSTLQRELQE